jgi:predicted transcriptional regulator
MTAKQRLLTEAELELMTALWRLGEASVSELLKQLPRGQELAYTTVSTIVRILEQKKFVKSRKEGRGHLYAPAVSREDYEARSVKHMVNSVFEGAPVGLARQLLKSGGLSPGELNEIRALLDKLESEEHS